MSNVNYTPPGFRVEAFHCPHCGTYAHQYWFYLSNQYSTKEGSYNSDGEQVEGLRLSRCTHCISYCIWKEGELIYPIIGNGPPPNPDTPDDVKSIYEEAKMLQGLSSRASAALLRLALQMLMPHLDEYGKNINDDIASLVKKGLDPTIQQSLDIVRVIGNNAVHPGQIDISDDQETSQALLVLLNLIVDSRISQPKKIAALYGILPQSSRDAIDKRDGKKP